MAFDQTAISALFTQVTDRARTLAEYEQVIQHEPVSAPQSIPALAVWWADIGPARGLSGLDATSARVEFMGRAYAAASTHKPEDQIEPKAMMLASALIGAYSQAFNLNGNVMAVDLLGAWGSPLAAQAKWIEHDGKHYRVAEITIPVVIDDVWSQEP